MILIKSLWEILSFIILLELKIQFSVILCLRVLIPMMIILSQISCPENFRFLFTKPISFASFSKREGVK
ncbi:hypothetical protein CN524_04935 [Bacillus sp. AFS019443]|nr:hypothetical protein CN524_04935 [Bacillus sp. AFS019443]